MFFGRIWHVACLVPSSTRSVVPKMGLLDVHMDEDVCNFPPLTCSIKRLSQSKGPSEHDLHPNRSTVLGRHPSSIRQLGPPYLDPSQTSKGYSSCM
jgi:hypothetical protein